MDGGTTYTDGEVSAPYSPYTYIAPLSAPVNLIWDTSIPTKASWDVVENAVSYTVQLYKGGVISGSAVTGLTDNYYDFTSRITDPGEYAFKVTAVADGTNYSNSPVSGNSPEYAYTVTLGTPGNLKWDTVTLAKAIWDAVSNASSYTVQLYKGGVASGIAETGITSTNFDFTSKITEPGSYTFTVAAIGDGTYYLTGSTSAQSAPYVKTTTLGTPDNLKWDTSIPAKATWDAVGNVSSYTIQLYKGGTVCESAVTDITSTNYDFTSIITEPGSYTFAVTAVGDETYYLTGSTSAQSAAYAKTTTLGVPANLKWDTVTPVKATWDAVTGAVSYTVQLYKGGAVSGSAITGITDNYYNLTSATMDAGSYTFAVTAVGDGTYYLTGSVSSLSAAYEKTATLGTPANLKWDTVAPAKATWDAVTPTRAAPRHLQKMSSHGSPDRRSPRPSAPSHSVWK